MRLSRFLHSAARTANDVEAVTSGKPERIAPRWFLALALALI